MKKKVEKNTLLFTWRESLKNLNKSETKRGNQIGIFALYSWDFFLINPLWAVRDSPKSQFTIKEHILHLFQASFRKMQLGVFITYCLYKKALYSRYPMFIIRYMSYPWKIYFHQAQFKSLAASFRVMLL